MLTKFIDFSMHSYAQLVNRFRAADTFCKFDSTQWQQVFDAAAGEVFHSSSGSQTEPVNKFFQTAHENFPLAQFAQQIGWLKMNKPPGEGWFVSEENVLSGLLFRLGFGRRYFAFQITDTPFLFQTFVILFAHKDTLHCHHVSVV